MTITAPEYIRQLNPYVPGKPIEETKREFGLKKVIKLASNENPLGPSPKARLALAKVTKELHRYPDGAAFHLKNALAKHEKIAPSNLVIGNGSNEIIDMLIRTFCVAGDSIVTSKGAFIAYKICAQIQGVRSVETEMGSDLRFDLGSMLEQVKRDPKAKIVFLANPNNPTGTYVRGDELRKFIAEVSKVRGGSVLVVLDSAYCEYVTAKDLPNPTTVFGEFPETVVVLKTFSKVYGLAGLRVGYAIGSPSILSNLEKVRMPFNLNSLALVAAEAALKDQAFVKRAVKANSDGMKFWEKGLKQLGIPFWPSQGNFILANVAEGLGKPGGEVYQSCLRRGVIFRPVANYGLLHALRISIGTAAENKIALAALAQEKKTSGAALSAAKTKRGRA